ncbi:tRNA lysidine(34) synthetase TilS [Nonlabens antarcticus]|uniref:tRNA lysidine(34) synthetase TilS n=1 Tax=Nonlabens antarcticus TaxID=392714 RepID=UPI0018918DB3|nr:tRNA lysidine(34) synthetase TilS [Nonlabens antarcticus]
MQQAFAQHIQQQFPQLFKKRFLIAISGGLDSVVLTHLLLKNNVDFELAHCNFNLRGAESDGDEEFVEQLAKELELKAHKKHFQTKKFAAEKGISTQMAARELRYDWFFQLLQEQGVKAILTAHHLDDQIETFMMNLNRGTGITGLSGIPEHTDQLLRPLLPFSRAQILAYARANGLTWREDSSNESNDYQRNALRNKVLPSLHEELPLLRANFSKTLGYLKDVESIVDDAVVRFRESVTTTNPTGIDYHLEEVKAYPNYKKYIFYVFHEYGFSNVPEVLRLMESETGKYLANAEYILLKDRDVLRLEKIQEPITKKWYLLPETTQVQVAAAMVVLETIATENPIDFVKSHIDKNVLWLDKERLEYPLTLQAWQAGDRMKPFGFNGSQLVSDILTNKKLSRTEKDRIMVLYSAEKVLWIPGIRSSKHFPVTQQTKEILKIKWIL